MKVGDLPLRLEPFHPYPIIKRVVSGFRAQGWRNACDLKLARADRLPRAFADCDRFKQILINLISNALAYTPQGVVTVQIWAEREKLWVMVKDTGIGIAIKDLPYVFQRFWRSDHSRQMPDPQNRDLLLQQEIAAIAENFPIFSCFECVAAIQSLLTERNCP